MSSTKTGQTIQCNQCGKEMYVPAWKMRNDFGKYCSRTCATEASKVRMSGLGASHKGPDGYIRIYNPTHPDATKNGIMLLHRLVAEQKYGRRLTKNEHVHHINGIRDDNRPENLELIGSGDHARVTMKSAMQKRKAERKELATLRRKVAEYEKLYGAIP